jgi:hypothetical protein
VCVCVCVCVPGIQRYAKTKTILNFTKKTKTNLNVAFPFAPFSLFSSPPCFSVFGDSKPSARCKKSFMIPFSTSLLTPLRRF